MYRIYDNFLSLLLQKGEKDKCDAFLFNMNILWCAVVIVFFYKCSKKLIFQYFIYRIRIYNQRGKYFANMFIILIFWNICEKLQQNVLKKNLIYTAKQRFWRNTMYFSHFVVIQTRVEIFSTLGNKQSLVSNVLIALVTLCVNV